MRTAFHDVETGATLTFRRVERDANRLGAGTRPARWPGRATASRSSATTVRNSSSSSSPARRRELIGVPLNWRQPVAELEPILARSGAKLILHDAAFAEAAASLAATLDMRRLRSTATSPTGYRALLSAEPKPPPARDGGAKQRHLVPALHLGHDRLPESRDPDLRHGLGQRHQYRPADRSRLHRANGLNFLPLFHTGGINLHSPAGVPCRRAQPRAAQVRRRCRCR